MNRFTESLVKYAAPFALASTVAACDDTVNQDFNLPDRVEVADAGNIQSTREHTYRTINQALIDPSTDALIDPLTGETVEPTLLNGSNVNIYCDTPTGAPIIRVGSVTDSPIGRQVGVTSELQGLFTLNGSESEIGIVDAVNALEFTDRSQIIETFYPESGGIQIRGNSGLFVNEDNPDNGSLYVVGSYSSTLRSGPYSLIEGAQLYTSSEFNPFVTFNYSSRRIISNHYVSDVRTNSENEYFATPFELWTNPDTDLGGIASMDIPSIDGGNDLNLNLVLDTNSRIYNLDTGEEVRLSTSRGELNNLYAQPFFGNPLVGVDGVPFSFDVLGTTIDGDQLSLNDLLDQPMISFLNNSGLINGRYFTRSEDSTEYITYTVDISDCYVNEVIEPDVIDSDTSSESDADTYEGDTGFSETDTYEEDTTDTDTPDTTQTDTSDTGTPDASADVRNPDTGNGSDAGRDTTTGPDATPDTSADSGPQTPDSGTPETGNGSDAGTDTPRSDVSVSPLERDDEGEVNQEEAGGCSTTENGSSNGKLPEEVVIGAAATVAATRRRTWQAAKEAIAKFFGRK